MTQRFFKKLEAKDVVPLIHLLRLPTLHLFSLLKKQHQEENLSKHLNIKDIPNTIKTNQDELTSNSTPR